MEKGVDRKLAVPEEVLLKVRGEVGEPEVHDVAGCLQCHSKM